MHPRPHLILLLAFATIAFAWPVLARSPEARACLTGAKSPQERQKACSEVIDSPSQSDTDKASAYNARGWIHTEARQYELALQDFERSLELNPQRPSTYVNRGVLYLRKKELDKALADFDKAIELDATVAAAFSYRGDALAAKGDMPAARQSYARAIELDPQDQRARAGKVAAAPKSTAEGGSAVPTRPAGPQGRPTRIVQGVFVVAAQTLSENSDMEVLLPFASKQACHLGLEYTATRNLWGEHETKLVAIVGIPQQRLMSLEKKDYPSLMAEVARITRSTCPTVQRCETSSAFNVINAPKCETLSLVPIDAMITDSMVGNYVKDPGLMPAQIFIRATIRGAGGVETATSIDDRALEQIRQRRKQEEELQRQTARFADEARQRKLPPTQSLPAEQRRGAPAGKCVAEDVTASADLAMNSSSRLVLPKGKVTIAGGLVQGDGFRTLDSNQVQSLRRLAQAGAIRVTWPQSQQSAQPFNWSGVVNVPNLTSRMAGSEGTIDVSPSGISADPSFQEEPDRFSVAMGTFKTTSVVSSEMIKQAGHTYCLAYILYDADIPAYLRDIIARMRNETQMMAEKRKGRVLFRLDPFAKAWVQVAGDYMNADQNDFTTDTVGAVLTTR